MAIDPQPLRSGTATSSTKNQILIVEDDAEIKDLLSLVLIREGYKVQAFTSALEAQKELDRSNCDLVILDWMLPGFSGIDFLKSLKRTHPEVSVLMVTAKSEPSDVVQGLESGADDYLTKPFDSKVLLARVKALLRRSLQNPKTSEVLRVGEIQMNLSTYEVLVAKQPVHLTPSEFKILSEMILNQGKVLTRERLIETAQGEGVTVTGRTIDTHVFGLRKKLGEQADWIETIRGVGYRIRCE
jgi:two-component system phosphate regulon response regulator PhoB